MTYLKLTLFGSPQLEQAGQPVAIGRRKGLALLAYLAMTDRAQHRDTLATLFWPGATQQRARGNLRQVLSDLNKVLDNERLLVEGEQIILARNDDLWLDVARFQACLELSQRHDHPPDDICPDCLPLLQEAADLSPGHSASRFKAGQHFARPGTGFAFERFWFGQTCR